MKRGSAPVIVDAKYRVVRRSNSPAARVAAVRSAVPGKQRNAACWTVLIVAINASLFVRLLMKQLLNWG